jgi:hypothetical protein
MKIQQKQLCSFVEMYLKTHSTQNYYRQDCLLFIQNYT